MKIRTKITLLQLSTLFCIFLSITVLTRVYRSSQQVKNLQVDFNKAIDLEKKLNNLLASSLYTEEDIAVYGEEIANTYSDLKEVLGNLYVEIGKNNKKVHDSFKAFYRSWEAVNSYYYTPVTSYFRLMMSPSNGWLDLIGTNGLVQTVDDLDKSKSDYKIKKQFLGKAIISIEKNSNMTVSIEMLMEDVREDIRRELEVNIATSLLRLVFIVLSIIILTMLISSWLSRRLISKIHHVEDTLLKISSGDLTEETEDKDNDEFTLLTSNFNVLSSMLLSKSSSMREIMTEIGDIISESINIDALLVKITELARKSSNADAAVILLVDKFSDILRVEHIEGFFPPPYTLSATVRSKRELIEEKFKSTPIDFGSSFLAKDSILKGKPLLIKDTQLDNSIIPINSNPQDILFIKSNITIPLVVANKLLGVISLAKTKGDSTFSDLDFSNMISFMEYVSLTIDNLYKYMELLEKSELKREINIASEIQSQLLPKKIPSLNGVDVTAFSNSARGISGDYFDIYKVSKNVSVSTVCDVAGKGIPAALVLVIIRTILQLASNSKTTAKDLLTFLNKSISDRVKTDYFATLSVLVHNSLTDEITVSVAGDTPLLVYRNKEQKVERIYHSDVPVGIDKLTVYKNINIDLEEDDIIYMFSDGLLEVRNDFDDIFTIEELESFILEYSNNRTETISVLLKKYLDEFRGSKQRMDDETVIIFKKI